MKAQYYAASGAIGVGSALRTLLFSMIPAALFGAIYGYWMYYVYALFTFWMPLVFAAAVGVAVGVIAKTNHIRSAGFVAVLGFVVGCAAIYIGWVAYLLAWSSHEYFAPLSDYRFLDTIHNLAAEGVWYFDEFKWTGQTLWIVWGLELIVVVFCCAYTAWGQVEASENPYCERCKVWAEQEWTSDYLDDEPMEDVDAFRSVVDREPIATLTALKRTQRISPGTQALLKVKSCSQCKDFNALDIVIETVTWDHVTTTAEAPTLLPATFADAAMMSADEDEEPSETIETNTIVDNLLVDGTSFELLKKMFSLTPIQVRDAPLRDGESVLSQLKSK